MRVIGTAGHVDHGKSTLVSALTGINPDRLKEEQVREMTIELGFAWLTLPDGQDIGIVDVPGHRDFIENMLAGVGGIDAVLFVIAADEGVMPQTREHLAILDLLQVKSGVLVLTKTDLIDDPDWIKLVEDDIRSVVRGTILEGAPLIPVSARKKIGLDELKQALMDCLADQPSRPDLGRARLPVDRIFTISGFGTVVTGTLLDGAFTVGDEIEIFPSGEKSRIRGLQTHKTKVETALPGSRTAVNLSGIEVEKINRGDVLACPGFYQKTGRVDAQFKLLKDASQPLKHDTEVKLFLGASEVQARLRLIGEEQILPGETGWIQLETKSPLLAVRGDRYILRRPSPGETLGGGVILDPHPNRRHKRFAESVVKKFEMLFKGTPTEVYYQDLVINGFASVKEVSSRTQIFSELEVILSRLIAENKIFPLDPGKKYDSADQLLISDVQYNVLLQKTFKELEKYHRNNPLRKGILREELKSRLDLPPKVFSFLVDKLLAGNKIFSEESFFFLPSHEVIFNTAQKKNIDVLFSDMEKSPYITPSVKECVLMLGEDVYVALLEQKQLIQVSADVVFKMQDYEKMLESVISFIKKEETISVAQFRDLFDTSRKYALALLEYLDKNNVTMRMGDVRKLRRQYQ